MMAPARSPAAGSLALALAFVLAGAGCTRQEIDKAGSSLASAMPALASAAPAAANDALIVAQIEAKFVAIDADSALHVAVASHGGAVRLSGRTKSREISIRYVVAARSVSGVKRIVTELVADPRLPTTAKGAADFALTTAVRANLLGQAGLNALGIGIKASGGSIILVGRVKTAALRTTLVDAAKATSGVRSVTDRMTVGS